MTGLPVASHVVFEAPTSSRDVVVDLVILLPNGPALVSPGAASKLCTSGRGLCGSCARRLCLKNLRPKHGHCRITILKLRAFAFAAHGDTGRAMPELDSRIDLVPILSTGTAATTCLPFDVAIPHYNLSCSGFAHDGNSYGAGVDAPSFFVGRNSLPPVTTGFVGERRFSTGPRHLQNDNSGPIACYRGVKDPSWQRGGDRRPAALSRGLLRRRHLRPHEFRSASLECST